MADVCFYSMSTDYGTKIKLIIITIASIVWNQTILRCFHTAISEFYKTTKIRYWFLQLKKSR